MKSAKLTFITGIALFTLLTIPVRLATQQRPVDGLQLARRCTGECLRRAGARPS
jgi:hypothetical protein